MSTKSIKLALITFCMLYILCFILIKFDELVIDYQLTRYVHKISEVFASELLENIEHTFPRCYTRIVIFSAGIHSITQ